MSQILDHLHSRVSPPIHELEGPEPTDAEIEAMVKAASRVPDHGRLEPWRFILYRGPNRTRVGELLADLLERKEGPLNESKRQKEQTRFNRAPLVIGVVFVPKPNSKIPEWEMFLSAGAAAMNLVHAAHGLGFKANWISNWYADDADGRAILGLGPTERAVGFVHIGRHTGTVADRARPEHAAVVTEWQPPAA